MYIEPPIELEGNEKPRNKVIYLTFDMLDEVPYAFHPLIAKLVEQGHVKLVLDGPDQIM